MGSLPVVIMTGTGAESKGCPQSAVPDDGTVTDYVESGTVARAPIRKVGPEPVADADVDEMRPRYFMEMGRRPLGRR